MKRKKPKPRVTRKKPIKVQAGDYAESCDNESGSFLAYHLIAIRQKAFLAGYRAAMRDLRRVKK